MTFSALPAGIKVKPSYFTLRRIDPGTDAPAPFTETHGGWRIEGAIPTPHVSREAILSYAMDLFQHARDGSRRQSLNQFIAKLRLLE